VESLANYYNRLWIPLMEAAGLVTETVEGDGSRKLTPFFSHHTLRHVAASIWIKNGASPKQVKTWAGHSRISTTFDIYGHLWQDPEDDQLIARAGEALLLD